MFLHIQIAYIVLVYFHQSTSEKNEIHSYMDNTMEDSIISCEGVYGCLSTLSYNIRYQLLNCFLSVDKKLVGIYHNSLLYVIDIGFIHGLLFTFDA